MGQNVYPHPSPEFVHFGSRRSVVHSAKAIVASTQPLANAAGIEVLRKGGNAAVWRNPEAIDMPFSYILGRSGSRSGCHKRH